MAENDSEMETFELDDTDDNLVGVADSIRDAIRNQKDVSKEGEIFVYGIDADVSEERFDVTVLIE